MKRLCATQLCAQPHHYEVQLINRRDGTPVQPLPTRTLEVAADEDLTCDDVIDLILMIDGGRDMPAANHAARLGVTEALVEEALAEMRREGL